jgi:hypothetical protein
MVARHQRATQACTITIISTTVSMVRSRAAQTRAWIDCPAPPHWWAPLTTQGHLVDGVQIAAMRCNASPRRACLKSSTRRMV